MSYSNSFPQQRPSLNLDFANGGDQLDSRISYSRSSTGTYLSNEKSLNSENLLLQSQDFDTSWTAAHMSAPTGSQTAPDGTSTAWLLSAASGTGAATIYQNASPKVSSNTSYTLVAHVKAGTASHAYISFRGAPAESAYALIDFASPLSPTSGGAVMTGMSSSSVALGNSWYRLTLTFTTATISSGYSFIYVGTSDGTLPVSGGYVNYDSTGDTIYAWGAQLSSVNSLVYDSPTTTQISREYSPLLKTAAADAPRFEYAADGQSVGTALGLLVESQASNLYPNSSDMTGNSGSLTNVDLNVAVGPTGDLTADALRLDATDANEHYRQYNFTSAASTAYTFSAYVKAAGLNYIAVRSTTNFSSAYTFFNVSSGTVEGSAPIPSTIESVGNGWFRCSVTATSVSATTSSFRIYVTDSPVSSTVAIGDSYRAVLGAGIQIEASSASSSLISTSGSTASRAADSCSLVSAPLLDNGSGGLTVEYDMRDASDTAYVLQLERSVGATNGGGVAVTNRYLFVENTYEDLGLTTSNVFHKFAASWESGSQKASRDGGAIVQDTATVVPADVNTLHIGTRQDGQEPINGHIRNIAIYSEPLSSTNLTTLSSS